MFYCNINGFILSINRQSLGWNVSDENYDIIRSEGRPFSLPQKIRNVFYTNIYGCSIIELENPYISTRFLPNGSWGSYDEYIGDWRKKVPGFEFILKYIPLELLYHPNVFSRHRSIERLIKENPTTGLMCFLNTKSTYDKSKKGDLLFVKNFLQDQIVYHIGDRDFENMKIVSNPEEAMENYLINLFYGNGDRFDFTPYLIPMRKVG